ncbi:MAG: SDR family oxidoreductase [Simkaniaceae bacterium]
MESHENYEHLQDVRPNIKIPSLLKGQKAIVTGGDSGIGRAISLALGDAGADVVVNYAHHDEKAKEVVSQLKNKGVNAYAYGADVSDERQVQKMFQKAIEELGTLDILINNAGLQRDSAFTDMTIDQWNKVISVNLTGQFLCSKEAIKEFKKKGIKPEISAAAGKIICMSSVHQFIPWAGHANYAASKGGIHMLMESLAQEMAGERIRVNAIAPGAIRTPINRSAWDTPEAYNKLMQLVPYKRIGEPEDIARAAVFLVSDLADYIVGTTIVVDGGMSLYPGFQSGG